MTSKFSDTIKALDGVSDFNLLSASTDKEGVETVRGIFKYNDLTFGFQQLVNLEISMNILHGSFKFHTTKKYQKIKLLEALNSFNRTTPGLKSSLKDVEDKNFSVSFTMEFICPDELIGESILSPSLKILSSSGGMLRDMFGRHGISLASKS